MKHTYHILGQFSGYWIGLVPEVPGAITFARTPQALVKMLDDAVAAIRAAEEKKNSKCGQYVPDMRTGSAGETTTIHTDFWHLVEEHGNDEPSEKETNQ